MIGILRDWIREKKAVKSGGSDSLSKPRIDIKLVMAN